MKRSFRLKILLGLGLAAFVALTAVLAGFYTFPYESAAKAVKGRIETSGPFRVSFASPRPGFPFRVSVDQPVLSLAGPESLLELMKADDLRLSLNPLGLLSRQVTGKFRLAAWGGHVGGRFAAGLAEPGQTLVDASEIDLPGFIFAGPEGLGRVEGRLTGRAEFSGTGADFPAKGQGVLRIGPGRIDELTIPNLPLTRFDFDRVEVEFVLEADYLELKRCEMTGPMGTVSFTGRIAGRLDPQWGLTGQAAVGPTRSHLAVSGPLFEPRFRVTGVSLNPGG